MVYLLYSMYAYHIVIISENLLMKKYISYRKKFMCYEIFIRTTPPL